MTSFVLYLRLTVTLFEGSLRLRSRSPRVRGLTRGFTPPSRFGI